MKHSGKTELNVDFIGGQEPLTKDEEKAISDYIKAKKAKPGSLLSPSKKRITKHSKLPA